MGPGAIFYFGKHDWRLGFAYNLVTSASYAVSGSTTKTWSGTGMSADFGYQFQISDGFGLGLRLNYSSSSFSSQLVNTTYTTISYSKTLIYPSVAMTFEF
jgi:hypothetical protein